MTADSWPSGGLDPKLTALQERYLSSLNQYDIEGLLRDERLGRIGVVSSFGTESVVLLHYASRVVPDIPIIFIDTGKHFDETLTYRDEVSERFDLNLRIVGPKDSDLSSEDPNGVLHASDTDTCCKIRKVFPLQDALSDFDSWISGRKRFQGSSRANIPVIERDGEKIKVNPLALWSKEQIDAYFEKHDLPAHPLESKGFPSVGCFPCTRAVKPGEDARAGRWADTPDKTECGIHLGPGGTFRRTTQ